MSAARKIGATRLIWMFSIAFAILGVLIARIGDVERLVREELNTQTVELGHKFEDIERRIRKLDGLQDLVIREFNGIDRQLRKLDEIEYRLKQIKPS